MAITTYEQEQMGLNLLRDNVPQLFDGHGKKLLYVGASVNRCQFARELREMGYETHLVEPFESNCWHYYFHNRIFSNVYQNLLGPFCEESKRNRIVWDVIFWWHGPEHEFLRKLSSTLNKVEMVSKLVILGSPYGYYPQQAEYGNEYEIHRSHLYPHDLEEFGYKTATAGPVDGKNESVLIGWKESKIWQEAVIR